MSSFNSDLFFGILIGSIAYIMQYIGKGIQKLAITGWQTEKSVKNKHSATWIGGTILTASFVFIQWIPLTVFHTPMSLIAPLEGIGLVSLLLFSFLVLKETLVKMEIIGILLIIGGTIANNLVTSSPTELTYEEFNLFWFLVLLGVCLGITIVVLLVIPKRYPNIKGVMIGLTAGSFMAMQTLAKRITDINSLALIFTFVTFVFATITLVLTQIALGKTRANLVVPSFTSASIILASILGVLVVNESLAWIQIGGIVSIVGGVIIMNLPRKGDDTLAKEVITPEP